MISIIGIITSVILLVGGIVNNDIAAMFFSIFILIFTCTNMLIDEIRDMRYSKH